MWSAVSNSICLQEELLYFCWKQAKAHSFHLLFIPHNKKSCQDGINFPPETSSSIREINTMAGKLWDSGETFVYNEISAATCWLPREREISSILTMPSAFRMLGNNKQKVTCAVGPPRFWKLKAALTGQPVLPSSGDVPFSVCIFRVNIWVCFSCLGLRREC